MQETLLLIELEVQEFCVDLKALSQLILSDLGATLQVFRLVGREYGHEDGFPTRMEDCIAAMGLQACKDAMSTQLTRPCAHSDTIAELWNHSREIARHSRHIAEETVDVDPDQAYLAGFCHSIGSLPHVLGWSGSKRGRFDGASVGAELAKEWLLPTCVVNYFADLHSNGGQSPWPAIVQAAHQRVGELAGECTFSEIIAPQLLWAV
jgi:HD-like signal output (HDOD) protein